MFTFLLIVQTIIAASLVATLVLGGAVAFVTSSTFAGRYASVVYPLFVLVAAYGVMVAVIFYPVLQAFWDSLFSYRLTAPEEREFVGLANYGVIFSDPVFWSALGVTTLITVVTVFVELILGFILAMVMHKAIKSTRGRRRRGGG